MDYATDLLSACIATCWKMIANSPLDKVLSIINSKSVSILKPSQNTNQNKVPQAQIRHKTKQI